MIPRRISIVGRLFLGFAALAALAFFAVPAAAKNLALVIRNDDYRNMAGLPKTMGNTGVIKDALTEIGFDVTVAENAGWQETTDTLAKFTSSIARDDIVLLYFSGYGIALRGENFLLPVDVPKPRNSEDDAVRGRGFDVDDLLSTLRGKSAKAVIALLDACRDIPFGRRQTDGTASGLAPIAPPEGTFVLTAAAAGRSARDRPSTVNVNEPSLFTRELAAALRDPRRPLVDIAKDVQQRVHDLASADGYDQMPAYYDAIPGSFVLSGSGPATAAEASPNPRDEESPSIGPIASPPPSSQGVHTRIVSVAPAAMTGNGLDSAEVRSRHGAWQIRCNKPGGGQPDQCALMQFVSATDMANVGLTVIVLKTGDKKGTILRTLVPLGVLVPSGLGLTIDSVDLGRAGYVRCLPNGCVAEVILEDALLQKLEHGTTALFRIFQTPEEEIAIPISLSGLADGMVELVR